MPVPSLVKVAALALTRVFCYHLPKQPEERVLNSCATQREYVYVRLQSDEVHVLKEIILQRSWIQS